MVGRGSWGQSAWQVWREGPSPPMGLVRSLPLVFLPWTSAPCPGHRLFWGGPDGETVDLLSVLCGLGCHRIAGVGLPQSSRAAGCRSPSPHLPAQEGSAVETEG